MDFPSIRVVVLFVCFKKAFTRLVPPPRSLFFVTLKLLLNSSAFLMEYCIALCRGKQKQTNQPNKTQKEKTTTQTKRKMFLIFLLKGSLTLPDKIFRRVPLSSLSSLFYQFCFCQRSQPKGSPIASTLLQGNPAAVATNGVVSCPLSPCSFLAPDVVPDMDQFWTVGKHQCTLD